MKNQTLLSVSLIFLFVGVGAGFLRAGSVDLQPVGSPRQVEVCQSTAWQDSSQIAFAAPADLAGGTTPVRLYARIIYLDRGQGLLRVFYPRATGEVQTVAHTRSSRTDTGGFVASYHELSELSPPASAGGRFLSVRLVGGGDAPLTIRSVTVQDQPFDDPRFQEVLGRPWAKSLVFPAVGEPPRATLKGSVMVGYQGWFRAANDLEDRGWVHWFRSRDRAEPAAYTVDMWPDTRAYRPQDRVPAGSIRTRSGRRAYLFSSTSEAVVAQHFRWMRQHRIDGAFLQRFLTTRRGGDDGTPEWVLMNVRKAADAEKRLWAIEYDLSGMSKETACEVLRRDWTWLHDVLKVTSDPYYARENGKPVVFVWGLPIPGRDFTPEVANQIVDYFQHDPSAGGNYVIGSLPNIWEELSPAWQEHIRRCDGMQVWQSHDYAVDQKVAARWGIDNAPHVWPGFSWAHLTRKRVPAAYTERGPGGSFYRRRIAAAFNAGCDRLFVGMFDEYDEGTAIMPMSDDPPRPGPPEGRFLTNRGNPPSLWLRITAEARRALDAPSPARNFAEQIDHRPYRLQKREPRGAVHMPVGQ